MGPASIANHFVCPSKNLLSSGIDWIHSAPRRRLLALGKPRNLGDSLTIWLSSHPKVPSLQADFRA